MPWRGGGILTRIEFHVMSHSTVDRALILLMLGGLLAASVAVWDATRDRSVNAGDLAPEFSVVTEEGKTLTRSDFGGKVLILNFWASWCAPCREETPSMEQLHQRLYRCTVADRLSATNIQRTALKPLNPTEAAA